ncbi:CsgE family curli-type amyloid fiber assembly protein [Cytophaga sp. FL35]|uniref:CsgE family curli-type amyloid fiber assembly protein n=1 Tax=Cytophaga sp. FL35 TaxID=1904456 RepID=UPI001653A1E5|nr:CsgE family curli-type amyloid fiber assembly protein [Cytophaga sp. FL35]MBC6998618.1 hypothetical protein [Cytophaga sp. FL35]
MHSPQSLTLSLVVFFLWSCSVLTGQSFNKEVEAHIDVDSENALTKIVFSAFNKTQLKKSLRYRALIVKNKDEKFEDEQYFIIESGERKNISTATLAIEEDQRTIVFVLIYEDEKVVGKDRLVINGFEGEDDLKPKIVSENNLLTKEQLPKKQDIDLMRGMVFENTKTKPGRDFYQMFYLAYNNNNINGNQIVKVDEVLAIGGNTQIKIYAGDHLIVQFFLNPRSSYLKEMVDQSIIRVNQYFIQNRAISQNTIQY